MVFIFIILASNMLRMTELMVNYGAGFRDIFNLILCQIPKVILFAMPAACLMAVLLSFIRMASDNEIIALRSSGINLYQLMPSVVLFSLICFLFAGFLTLYWTPHGNRSFESVFINIMKTRVESVIKEGVFMPTDDFVLYVNNYLPKDKIMKDVFFVIKNKEREITIVAKKAKFISDDGRLTIQFTDSKVFTEGKDGETIVAEHPDVSNYPFPIDSMMKSSENHKLDPDGMYLEELSELINNPEEDARKKNIAKLTLYEMFSLPFAVLFIGMAGAPLGARIKANGRTKGIIISLL